jgi:lipid-binding SYLF domain-containing protein
MMKRIVLAALTLAFALLPYSAAVRAADKRKTPEEFRAEMRANVQGTIDRFKKTDPGIERFLKESAGYAVFPTVAKMGFVLAGGYGEGEVYDAGKVVGVASVSFGSVGLTAGAQEYSEIIFFKDKADLERFKQNKFEFDAAASAVVWKSGAAKSANYTGGVAVFVHPKGGVMAEASVGGQKFSFKPEAK